MTDLYQHVLVPLDASSLDQVALDLAADTAARTGAEITLLLPRVTGVLERLKGFADAVDLALPDAAVAYLGDMAAGLRPRGVSVREVSVPSTDAACDIAHLARHDGVTLILLPTPHPPSRRQLRAGTAERLMRYSSVPVLAVPGLAVPRTAGAASGHAA